MLEVGKKRVRLSNITTPHTTLDNLQTVQIFNFNFPICGSQCKKRHKRCVKTTNSTILYNIIIVFILYLHIYDMHTTI